MNSDDRPQPPPRPDAPLPRMRGFSGGVSPAAESPRPDVRPPQLAASLRSDAPSAGVRPIFADGTGRREVTPPTAPATATPPLAKPSRMPGPCTRPTPLPKRPKGRLLLGAMLLTMCGWGAYAVWNSLLRYDAYGIVTGRVIRVPATHGGSVRAIHFREGELVEQGRLLVTLDNVELNQQLARLGDELLISQANLDAEISKLHWQAQQQGDLSQRAAADYLELCGELVQEQARLDELQARFDRESTLREIGAISASQLDETRFALQGQKAKVAKRTEGLAERRKLAEASQAPPPTDQLKPLFVKIEVLQAEMSRVRELIKQCQVRAPVSGRVIRSLYFTGERVDPSSIVMEILEDGSLEAVIYLRQNKVPRFTPGQQLQLQVPSLPEKIVSTVERFGEQYHSVPAGLERHYYKCEPVLPVHVRLHLAPQSRQQLQLGCEVRLPHCWPWQTRVPDPPAWPGEPAVASVRRPATEKGYHVAESPVLVSLGESHEAPVD